MGLARVVVCGMTMAAIGLQRRQVSFSAFSRTAFDDDP